MSKPGSIEREQSFKKFLEKTNGIAYSKRALVWFQDNLNEIVTADELARIPGKDGKPINHNMRRIFELRDEAGYDIINHKDFQTSGIELRVDEWMLRSPGPQANKIRERGVNKRIAFEVFDRDKYTCQICGRNPNDDDPFKPGHKIKLHVGHIIPHKDNSKRVDSNGLFLDIPNNKTLSAENFVTMCNVCNEGAKNIEIKRYSMLDRIKEAPMAIKEEVYEYLKNELDA